MKYLFPYTYGFDTRVKGIFYKVSFFVIIFFPMFVAYPLVNLELPDWKYCVCFVIAFTGFYCIYENGYITNDYLTTRFEDEPVIRLTDNNRKIEKMSEIYRAIRVLYAFGSCFILSKYFDYSVRNFVLCLVILNMVYSIHNFARGKWNIPTIFILEVMKYITVQSLFLQGYNYLIYCLAIVINISLERSITYSLQRRLKIKYNEDFARLIYYVLMIIIGVFAYILLNNYVFLFYSVYMFCFRAACYIFTKIFDVSKIRRD